LRVAAERPSNTVLDTVSVVTQTQFALLFDCDGVIVETEELHRVAYNQAFEAYDITLPNGGGKVHWDVPYYDILQNTVGGGKPKMKWYFTNTAKTWPAGYESATSEEQDKLCDMLQNKKVECFLNNMSNVKARPGVIELMDEAINHPNVKVGICSASGREGFEKLVDVVVGKERLDVIIN
jgi:beta-phosphoglucomutase-like phosphatase (HAD superfamily)